MGFAFPCKRDVPLVIGVGTVGSRGTEGLLLTPRAHSRAQSARNSAQLRPPETAWECGKRSRPHPSNLIAHLAGGERVAGSNPVAPTNRKPAVQAGSSDGERGGCDRTERCAVPAALPGAHGVRSLSVAASLSSTRAL